jgi:hypothetical protein
MPESVSSKRCHVVVTVNGLGSQSMNVTFMMEVFTYDFNAGTLPIIMHAD